MTAEAKRIGVKVKPIGSRGTKRIGNMTSIIYDELRVKILNGQLRPGAPLSVLSIAKARGTSRGPVREALRRLQQDQLVIAKANKRFNIAPFDIADLEAVLSLHLVNITLAIRVGVPFLSDKEVEGLGACVQHMEQSRDSEAFDWEEAHRAFVFILIKHMGERTMSLIGNLIDDIQRYRANVLSGRHIMLRPPGSAFKGIVEAVLIRDGEAASFLYADLFGRLSSLILAYVAPRYDACRLRNYNLALIDEDRAT